MTDREILQGIDKLEDGIPFDEIRNGDKWLDIHELLSEIRERIGAWHYPSKGEYPKEREQVLFISEGKPYLGTYSEISNYWDSLTLGCPSNYVDCWQNIVPPQEEV